MDDAGETVNILEETLQREILEEVGVEISDMIYVHSTAFVDNASFPVVDVVFLCRWMAGEPTILEPQEVADIRWLTANEVLTNPDTPDWTRNSVRRAEKMRNMLGW